MERWTFKGEEVEVVSGYKYLGLTLSPKLSVTQAVADMVVKAKQKVVSILRSLRKVGCADWDVFIKIFDVQIQPALLYASEIWGMARVETVERVHLFALKRYLAISKRTPSMMVYGETGRFPLYVNSYRNCVRYWLRLITMQDDRLPKLAYKTSCSLSKEGKNSWANKVKYVLCSFGFGEAWVNQGVGNPNLFLYEFTERVKVCFQQDWHWKVESDDRFVDYRLLKVDFGICEHIKKIPAFLRGPFLRLRLGVSGIKCHLNRFQSEENADLVCPFCPSRCEDERHFLFSCPGNDAIRPNCLVQATDRSHLYERTMAPTNEDHLRSIAWFIFKAFKIRTKFLEEN